MSDRNTPQEARSWVESLSILEQLLQERLMSEVDDNLNSQLRWGSSIQRDEKSGEFHSFEGMEICRSVSIDDGSSQAWRSFDEMVEHLGFAHNYYAVSKAVKNHGPHCRESAAARNKCVTEGHHLGWWHSIGAAKFQYRGMVLRQESDTTYAPYYPSSTMSDHLKYHKRGPLCFDQYPYSDGTFEERCPEFHLEYPYEEGIDEDDNPVCIPCQWNKVIHDHMEAREGRHSGRMSREVTLAFNLDDDRRYRSCTTHVRHVQHKEGEYERIVELIPQVPYEVDEEDEEQERVDRATGAWRGWESDQDLSFDATQCIKAWARGDPKIAARVEPVPARTRIVVRWHNPDTSPDEYDEFKAWEADTPADYTLIRDTGKLFEPWTPPDFSIPKPLLWVTAMQAMMPDQEGMRKCRNQQWDVRRKIYHALAHPDPEKRDYTRADALGEKLIELKRPRYHDIRPLFWNTAARCWISTTGHEMKRSTFNWIRSCAQDVVVEGVVRGENVRKFDSFGLAPSRAHTLAARTMGIIGDEDVLPFPAYYDQKAPERTTCKITDEDGLPILGNMEFRKYRCLNCLYDRSRRFKVTHHAKDSWKAGNFPVKFKGRRLFNHQFYGSEGHWKCLFCGNPTRNKVLKMIITVRPSPDSPVVQLDVDAYGDGFIDQFLLHQELEHSYMWRALALARQADAWLALRKVHQMKGNKSQDDYEEMIF